MVCHHCHPRVSLLLALPVAYSRNSKRDIARAEKLIFGLAFSLQLISELGILGWYDLADTSTGTYLRCLS